MSALSDLIARLEKATADNEHIAIYDALMFAHNQGWISDGQYDLAMVWRNVGAYLCAALTLVPSHPVPNIRPGQWWWMVEAWPSECKANVAYENGDSGIIEEEGKAPTPALALVSAALRARRGE